MKVIGKDRTSCDVCNPIDEILARLDALERRASAIVAKVQGITPDGEGNVTLPTSSSDTDPLHGRVDTFAMSSEVKEAADDAHAYATSIADDVVVINSEIEALNQAVEALQPAEIEALKSAVQTLQTTVATLESTVATLNNSVAEKVSKSGDTMTGNLMLSVNIPPGENSNKAATTKWTNTASSLVHITGTEDIRGFKKFTNPYWNVAGFGYKDPRYGINSTDKPLFNGVFKWLSQIPLLDMNEAIISNDIIQTNTDNSIERVAVMRDSTNVQRTIYSIRLNPSDGGMTMKLGANLPSEANDREVTTANWVLTKINELATKNGLSGL